MPTIKPYQQQTSPEGSLGGRQASGSDVGGTGLQGFGQAAASAGMDLARAGAIMEHNKATKEATDAAVFLSESQTILATGLDADALAWKPGMDTVAGTTMGKVKNMLDGGAGQFTTPLGQATYRKHAASLTAHFAEISGHIQAKLDGEVAVQQREALINTKGVFLQTHPAYAPLVLDEMATVLGDPQGQFARQGALAQQKGVVDAQERVAIDGVQGLIRMTPLLAEEILTDKNLAQSEQYGWITKHIPHEKMAPLIEHARVMADLEVRKQDQAAAALAKATDLAQKAKLGEATVKWINDQADPNYNPAQSLRENISFFQQNPDAVMAHPDMVRAAISAHRADIAEQKAGKTAGNTDLEDRLTAGIISGSITDFTPVLQARGRADDPISTEQMNRLERVFRDRTSPEGFSLNEKRSQAFKAVEQYLAPKDKFGAFLDNSMVFQVERARRYADGVEAQYRKEKKNLFPLYDIESPEYLFTPERVAPFMRSMTDRLDNAVKQMFPPTAAESALTPAPSASSTPKAPAQDTRPPLGGILFKHFAPKGQP